MLSRRRPGIPQQGDGPPCPPAGAHVIQHIQKARNSAGRNRRKRVVVAGAVLLGLGLTAAGGYAPPTSDAWVTSGPFSSQKRTETVDLFANGQKTSVLKGLTSKDTSGAGGYARTVHQVPRLGGWIVAVKSVGLVAGLSLAAGAVLLWYAVRRTLRARRSGTGEAVALPVPSDA